MNVVQTGTLVDEITAGAWGAQNLPIVAAAMGVGEDQLTLVEIEPAGSGEDAWNDLHAQFGALGSDVRILDGGRELLGIRIGVRPVSRSVRVLAGPPDLVNPRDTLGGRGRSLDELNRVAWERTPEGQRVQRKLMGA